MKKYKPYIISFCIAFAVAIAGGIVTYLNMSSFEKLIQPLLSPPGFLFPIVWTILYALMAFSAARIYIRLGNLNSFIWLIILWVLVLAMIIVFYRTDKTAALLQLPYILWLSFAAYLNLSIYLINFT